MKDIDYETKLERINSILLYVCTFLTCVLLFGSIICMKKIHKTNDALQSAEDVLANIDLTCQKDWPKVSEWLKTR